MRTEKLLKHGCMPLLPSASRNWVEEDIIALPSCSPMSHWPPTRWTTYSPDAKLLLWETVSTALAIHDGTEIDRGEILDIYNYLALPGSGNPQLRSTLQTARYHNYKTLLSICLGKCTKVESNKQIVLMLETAKSRSVPTITADVILEQIERKQVSIRT